MSSYRLRKLVSFIERIGASIFGRILWPPASAQTICWTDHNKEELIVLKVGDRYHFPGGLIKNGEHPKEAAKREFNEETSMKIEINDLIRIKTKSRNNDGIHFFYEGFLDGDYEPKSTWEEKPVKLPKDKIKHKLDEIYATD